MQQFLDRVALRPGRKLLDRLGSCKLAHGAVSPYPLGAAGGLCKPKIRRLAHLVGTPFSAIPHGEVESHRAVFPVSNPSAKISPKPEVNRAVTLLFEVMIRLQDPEPVHAPLQVEKIEPLVPLAVRDTPVPES